MLVNKLGSYCVTRVQDIQVFSDNIEHGTKILLYTVGGVNAIGLYVLLNKKADIETVLFQSSQFCPFFFPTLNI